MAEGVEPTIVLAHTINAPDLTQPKRSGRERVKLTDAELWERRREMARLHASGKYLRAIADEMGLAISTVHHDIQAVVNAYKEEAIKTLAEKIAREEALIYLVQLEAIGAWYESKQGKITNNKKRAREIRRGLGANAKSRKSRTTNEQAVASRIRDEIDDIFNVPQGQEAGPTDQVIEKNEQYERLEDSPGDPRFLAIILDCSDRRAKLNALYPKQDFAGGVGGHPGSLADDDDFTSWTPAQRMARLDHFLQKGRLEKAKRIALSQAEVVALALPPAQTAYVMPPSLAQQPLPVIDEDDGEALWNATR